MRFVSDEPALLLDEFDRETLVVSDMHLGIEYEIYKKGVKIPPRMERQRSRISDLLDRTSAERLMMLGDVKHNVPAMSIGEKENLPGFFRSLEERTEVIVVKGNHDGAIEGVSGDVEVTSTSGIKVGDFYFNHGHAWPGKEVLDCETLIRGHSHPAVEFKDRLGFSSVMPCWIRAGVDGEKLAGKLGEGRCALEEVVIVPTFNKMIDGMAVNGEREEALLGPLLENKIVNLGKGKAYLLDGTFLGIIEDL